MNKYPKVSARFDLIFVFLSLWLTIGVFVDGWAHNHLSSSLETFFTPWHGIFYAGFGAVSLSIFYQAVKNYRLGFRWPYLLAREYHLAFLGLILFFLAGAGDMIWHIIFGIEVDVEALLSPTHLLLALGGSIIMCAPFHSIWHRDIKEKPSNILILFSLVFFLSALTFMTQFASPMHRPWMDINFITNPVDSGQALGVASILIQTGIFMGVILATLRKWKIPFGGFAFVLGLNTILMSVLTDQYRFIPVFIISGLIIDLLYKFLKPSIFNPRGVRIFSILTPMIMYGGYTVTIFLTSGTWWSIHLWAGAIVMAGITGFLLSYLIVEPARGEINE